MTNNPLDDITPTEQEAELRTEDYIEIDTLVASMLHEEWTQENQNRFSHVLKLLLNSHQTPVRSNAIQPTSGTYDLPRPVTHFKGGTDKLNLSTKSSRSSDVKQNTNLLNKLDKDVKSEHENWIKSKE